MKDPAHSQMAPWVQIFSSEDARSVAELALVLESRSIPSIAERDGRASRLVVRESDAAAAIRELRQYELENARPLGGPRAIEFIGQGWPGVFFYVALLLVVAICEKQSLLNVDWLGAGGLVAGRVTAGEWWRTITALTLHVDYVHLLGNILFGSFFGYFVARYLGSGMGWCAILLSGAAGNLINAFVQAPEHRAIGASTAVFAALGILVSYTWKRGFLRNTPWRVRFAPITAGIALLAFTGAGGENTDLGGHLFGFLAGTSVGLWLAMSNRFSTRVAQIASAATGVAVLLLSWYMAAALD